MGPEAGTLDADIGGLDSTAKPPIDLKSASDLAEEARVRAVTDGNNRWNDGSALERTSGKMYVERDKSFAMRDRADLLKELLSTKPEEFSEPAKEFLAEGGSIESLLTELQTYMEQGIERDALAGVDVDLKVTREKLVQLAITKHVFHREKHAAELKAAQDAYQQACLNKIRQVFSTNPDDREASLQTGHLPQVIEKLTFNTEQGLSLEDLAGSHIHVLVDLLCREEMKREELAEQYGKKGVAKVANFFKENKTARGVACGALLATGVFGIVGPHIGDQAHEAVTLIQQGAIYLGAYFTSRRLLEDTFGGVRDAAERVRNKRKLKALASDQELTTIALRTAYDFIESDGISDRSGTASPAENLERFQNLKEDFVELQTAPEYYQYDGRKTLPYIYDIYVSNKDRVEDILSGENPEQAYYQLAELMIQQDVAALRKELMVNKALKWAARGLAAGVSILSTRFVGKIDDAKGFADTSAGIMAGNVEAAKIPKRLIDAMGVVG